MSTRSVPRRLVNKAITPLAVDEPRIALDLLRDSTARVMLDVGAHVGHSLMPFVRKGWHVHAFEPDPTNRAHLEEELAKLSGQPVEVVPKAVSDAPGRLQLFTSPESTGISSLAPFTSSHEATAEVEVIRLDSYLEEHGIDRVGFLKIDVEGYEKHVLAGYDWRVQPDVIVLEFEDHKTVPLGYTWTDLADTLVDQGYDVTISEWAPIERYGIAHTWVRFASYPDALASPEGWGNLIAQRRRHPATDTVLSRAARRARLAARLRPFA